MEIVYKHLTCQMDVIIGTSLEKTLIVAKLFYNSKCASIRLSVHLSITK